MFYFRSNTLNSGAHIYSVDSSCILLNHEDPAAADFTAAGSDILLRPYLLRSIMALTDFVIDSKLRYKYPSGSAFCDRLD